MKSDADLLQMTNEAWENLLGIALKSYKTRKNAPMTMLAKSPLATSSLVLDCLMDGEEPQLQLRYLGVCALLRWAIAQLWTGSQFDQVDNTDSLRQYVDDQNFRLYTTLYLPCVEGKTFQEASDFLQIEGNGIYVLRKKALRELAKHLQEELQTPHSRAVRKNFAIRERYRLYASASPNKSDKQALLRFCTLLAEPLPAHTLKDLSTTIGISKSQGRASQSLEDLIGDLINDGWLVQTSPEYKITLRADDDLRAYLETCLTTAELEKWCQPLVDFYIKRGEYFTAAMQLVRSEQYSSAVKLLREHCRGTLPVEQLQQLREFYKKLSADDRQLRQIDQNTQASLQILVGRAAVVNRNIDEAIAILDQAVNASEPMLKAEAHYYLAEAYYHVALPELSRQSVEYAMDVLSSAGDNHDPLWATLQVNLHVRKAWIYMQFFPEISVAEAALRKVEQLLPAVDSDCRSNWTNAWGCLNGRLAKYSQEIATLFKAVQEASGSSDDSAKWKALHNFAQACIHARLDVEGRYYL